MTVILVHILNEVGRKSWLEEIMKCSKCNIESQNNDICPNCGRETETVSENKSKLVKLSSFFLYTGLFCILFTILFVIFMEYGFPDIFGIIFGVSIPIFLFSSLVTAIIGGIQISLNKYKQRDYKDNTSTMITLASILIFSSILIAPSILNVKSYAYRMMCGTNLSGLGKAIMIYANDYNEAIPWDSWCDKLVMYADVSPNQFLCQQDDVEYGESSYALNKNFIGQGIEIPSDAVLAFETDLGKRKGKKDFNVDQRLFAKEGFGDQEEYQNQVYESRWNQVAGPEALSITHHRGHGCNILFGDMHVSFETINRLADLNWGLKEGESFPKEVLEYIEEKPFVKYYIAGAIALVVFILSVIVCIKYKTNSISKVLLFGFIALIFGVVFGFFSEALHNSNLNFPVGPLVGAFLGFFIGVSYLSFVSNIIPKLNYPENSEYLIKSVAIAIGLLCALILHLMLDLIYDEGIYISLIGGLGYGIIAGTILGKIASGMIKTDTGTIHENKI